MSTRAQLLAEVASQFPDNTSGAITPAILRAVFNDLVNSALIPASDGAGTTAVIQKGFVNIVAGVQSYAIVFSPSFASIPTDFDPKVYMPNSSGEALGVDADLSTLSVSGVTVWLTGVPTSASNGGRINWRAEL